MMIVEPDSKLVADLQPSPNIEPRLNGLRSTVLVMHYTGLPTVEKSIEILSRPDCKVSCHYVIDVDGRIVQMVREDLRAWHAGVSSWHGETDINSCSIGIEIQNVGHNAGYPDFPRVQMDAVSALTQDILSRHAIANQNVVAHSDIAPGRKTDPGEKFDWAWLSAQGVGHWVQPSKICVDDTGAGLGTAGPEIAEFQAQLKSYGYGIRVTGIHNQESLTVVSAFQRHFRPERFDGIIDRSTVETLERLTEELHSTSSKEVISSAGV